MDIALPTTSAPAVGTGGTLTYGGLGLLQNTNIAQPYF